MRTYRSSLVRAEYPLAKDRLPFLVPLQGFCGYAAERDAAPALAGFGQVGLAFADATPDLQRAPPQVYVLVPKPQKITALKPAGHNQNVQGLEPVPLAASKSPLSSSLVDGLTSSALFFGAVADLATFAQTNRQRTAFCKAFDRLAGSASPFPDSSPRPTSRRTASERAGR